MGSRSSTASCFKIIGCGCDSEIKDTEDLKGPSDKSGWSFRKRFARDRVLTHIVTSETESFLNKEIPETVNVDFKPQSDITWIEENPNLSSSMKLHKSAIEKDKAVAAIVNLDEEYSAVSVQAAIRAYLAQNQLLKLRNVVMLQAMVRGHLVRRHAVGTLRCIQAITKLQALVRSHQARGSVKKQSFDSMLSETSMETLLSNKFAFQLLASIPRTKQIYVKCDSSKADAASKWLYRWMSVLSRGHEQFHKPGSNDNNVIIESEEENLITYDVVNLDFLACKPHSQNQNVQHTDCKNLTSCSRKMMIINSFAPMDQYGGSECGTELSISSTLDSPDRPETHDRKPESLSIQPIEINKIDSMNVNQANGDKLKSKIGHQVCHSSVEASPSSKKDGHDKNILDLNHRSLSSGSNVGYKQLTKGGKKNNSSGLGKTDTIDEDPRDSCSSNSLPSYMQATESARAKAIAKNSPRSSPDVQDKDITTIKKRNSLPTANVRYGSPHVQMQQDSKGNVHPTERKWLR